jgi:hypothetical protein
MNSNLYFINYKKPRKNYLAFFEFLLDFIFEFFWVFIQLLKNVQIFVRNIYILPLFQTLVIGIRIGKRKCIGKISTLRLRLVFLYVFIYVEFQIFLTFYGYFPRFSHNYSLPNFSLNFFTYFLGSKITTKHFDIQFQLLTWVSPNIATSSVW